VIRRTKVLPKFVKVGFNRLAFVSPKRLPCTKQAALAPALKDLAAPEDHAELLRKGEEFIEAVSNKK